MSELTTALRHPEYIHVLLNPIPLYVLGTGVVILVWSLFRKSREAQTIGLWILVLAGIAAWPTWYFGHQAYHHLYDALSTEGQEWADVHLHRASRTIYIYYATGIIALAAIFLPRKIPKATIPLTIAALLAGTVSFGLGLWIAKAGGQIRHSEFRFSHPAEPTQGEHHH